MTLVGRIEGAAEKANALPHTQPGGHVPGVNLARVQETLTGCEDFQGSQATDGIVRYRGPRTS